MREVVRWRAWVAAAAVGVLASCDGGVSTAPHVDYESGALWDAPWPDERLRREDGTIDVSDFPNPRRVPIVEQLRAVLEHASGFGVSSTIYFPLTDAIDPASLPDVHESVRPEASVFVVDVDDGEERGRRIPLVARFDADPGPFGTPNLLALLPLQGRPLRPGRLHAAVLTTRVRTADGRPLAAAPATVALLRGERPSGMSERAFDAHLRAREVLRSIIADREIAAIAVFRTWDPVAELRSALAHALANDLPAPEAPFTLHEVFDDYCVYHTTIRMPVYQEGDPPYTTEGGGWARDASGALVLQHRAESNLWITVPRRTMPEAGFPAAVFVRTGGGGDRPLVDRGPHATAGGEAPPGTGPAMHFARAGYLGISVDGPLGGLRNETGWDEQFAIFNIANPVALRDSIRQSALELALLAHVVPELRADASECPDVSTPAGDGVVRADPAHLALMGHSMGATIAPLTAAVEPRYAALVLSGAGASWIENVMFKLSPLEVRSVAEALLGYASARSLVEHDPVLALLQWAGEPADPQVYAPDIASGSQHVLMFQGILDTYIPPPVANALSLALELDLAGDPLDTSRSEYEPLLPLLPLAGRRAIPLPAAGNEAEGTVTAVVVQHHEDGIEDGHEVVFQRPEPQLQYRCFLETLARGVPRVPAASAAGCD